MQIGWGACRGVSVRESSLSSRTTKRRSSPNRHSILSSDGPASLLDPSVLTHSTLEGHSELPFLILRIRRLDRGLETLCQTMQDQDQDSCVLTGPFLALDSLPLVQGCFSLPLDSKPLRVLVTRHALGPCWVVQDFACDLSASWG